MQLTFALRVDTLPRERLKSKWKNKEIRPDLMSNLKNTFKKEPGLFSYNNQVFVILMTILLILTLTK